MAALPQQESTLAAIDRAVEREADDGLRYHLGASVIGDECDRKLWYIFRWVGAESKSGRMLRLFDRGAREEEALIGWLRKAGVTVWDRDPASGQQFRVSEIGGHFGGSLDGVAMGIIEAPEKPHVLEFKTMNEKSFNKLQKVGVEKAQPKHFTQMQIYMELMDIERAFYLVVCKNDDRLYAERVRRSATVARQALKRAERIITSDRPPARISDDPTLYVCKFCDYREHCHVEATPLANCRTCIHSTPELDGHGRWSCSRHFKDLTEKEQRAGCPTHLFIPELIAKWAEQHDADDGNVYYVNKLTGNRFANGPDGYLSSEIAAASDVRVIGAYETEELRREFGGEVVG